MCIRDRVTKTARMDKEAAKELDFLQKIKKWLEDGKMAITMELENEDEEMCIRDRRKRARKAPERTGIVNEAESGKREKDVSKSRKEASV